MSGQKDRYALMAADDALTDLDRSTILRCIDVVAQRAEQLKGKGLSSWTFFFGVTNMLLVTWCFGVYPQHFWIVYVVETLTLFPIRFKHMSEARPTQVLYWLDFCWVANILCNIGLIFFLVDKYFEVGVLEALGSGEMRKHLFCIFFSAATGPLLLAVGALGNALVFHDADYFDEIRPFVDIYAWGVAIYFVWSALYTSWIICCGLRLPDKGYDTVFHATMRDQGTSNPVVHILGWSAEEVKTRVASNDFTPGSVLLYMAFHAMACCLGMLFSVGCFVSIYFHGSLCVLMALTAIYKGSARYSYYMTENYTNMLRKEFSNALKETP
eukprot:TRINITY_DN26439_c0_g1_i2.p1 TRINITY_DN26439_c0_g1~~TRINITY_DN26439_c0_g1_i2.p1  ORF type:complete len:326 (-),score=63.89 TRINITY_DN26439_c0_g1_i2:123-1100(-)